MTTLGLLAQLVCETFAFGPKEQLKIAKLGCCIIFQGSLSVPLGIAAQKGFIEIVRILLGAGANVNHQNKVRYVYSDTVAC